jgi:hypothetical protein
LRCVWQFCDIKVDQTNTSSNRPGGINNKGVVRKTVLFEPFIYKNDLFTKTGSGQNIGKALKKEWPRFLQVSQWRAPKPAAAAVAAAYAKAAEQAADSATALPGLTGQQQQQKQQKQQQQEGVW